MIETERLRLRKPTPNDFDASYTMWSDPRVTEHISGVPSTRSQTWSRLLAVIGHWTAFPYGSFVVEEAATGAFAGEIGLSHFKRDITPSIDAFPEAGWAFSPAMHGRGYATEALRGVLAWADATIRAPRIVALSGEANVASLRVAEKAGFREYDRITFNGIPARLVERTKSELFSASRAAIKPWHSARAKPCWLKPPADSPPQ
jgi:RimJ/RimL family protein N-acetyltransferase